MILIKHLRNIFNKKIKNKPQNIKKLREYNPKNFKMMINIFKKLNLIKIKIKYINTNIYNKRKKNFLKTMKIIKILLINIRIIIKNRINCFSI